jgi:Tol biopolymer transport system component
MDKTLSPSIKRLGLLTITMIAMVGCMPNTSTDRAVLGATPAPSLDGHIFFLSIHRYGSDSYPYLMNIDGSNVIRLDEGLPYGDVSSDGSQIVYSNGENIYLDDVNDENSILLAAGIEPVWSPDGSQIAFNSSRDGNIEIYLMNADGSNQVNLTNNSSLDGFSAWSPDGSQIAFLSNRDGNREIYVMNADGSNQVNLTNHSDVDVSPSWSPDGSQIAFVSNRDGNHEIYVMNADGSNQVNLTNNDSVDDSMVWSLDRTQIVFVSQRDGNSEIYIMNADGSNQVNLTNSEHFDYAPEWRP